VFDRCSKVVPPLEAVEYPHADACLLPFEEKKRIFAAEVVRA
jgi:hypothetical protein